MSTGIRRPSSRPWSYQGCFVVLRGDPGQEQRDTRREKARLCRSLAHCIRFPWLQTGHRFRGLKSTHNVTSYFPGVLCLKGVLKGWNRGDGRPAFPSRGSWLGLAGPISQPFAASGCYPRSLTPGHVTSPFYLMFTYLAVPGPHDSRQDLRSCNKASGTFSCVLRDLSFWHSKSWWWQVRSSPLTRDRTLLWEHGVLATGPPGKSPGHAFSWSLLPASQVLPWLWTSCLPLTRTLADLSGGKRYTTQVP